MDILLTGISGFVGSNVAKYLTDRGYRVVGVCRRNVEKKIDGVTYMQVDLSKEIMIDDHIDAVVHVAGQVEDSCVDGYVNNTILSMRNLLTFCKKKEINQFIFTSTIAVYGEVDGKVNENTDKKNLNTYALAKVIAERMLDEAELDKKWIIRLPRVLGEGLDYSFPWIPKLTRTLILNQDVNYFNPDLPYNNLVHVEDVAAFLEHILCNDKFVGKDGTQIIGLASEEGLCVKEIIDILYKETGSLSKLIEKKSTGRNTAYWIDITKSKQYGFQPRSAIQTLKEFAKISLNAIEMEAMK